MRPVSFWSGTRPALKQDSPLSVSGVYRPPVTDRVANTGPNISGVYHVAARHPLLAKDDALRRTIGEKHRGAAGAHAGVES